MIQLMYTSKATVPGTPETLRAMLEVSRDRNSEVGITGLLIYAQDSFLQLLEGGAADVDQTFRRIADDPRHSDIRLLERQAVRHRGFGEWSMGFERPDAGLFGRVMDGFRPAAEHALTDPSLIPDARAARTLVTEFARHPLER